MKRTIAKSGKVCETCNFSAECGAASLVFTCEDWEKRNDKEAGNEKDAD